MPWECKYALHMSDVSILLSTLLIVTDQNDYGYTGHWVIVFAFKVQYPKSSNDEESNLPETSSHFTRNLCLISLLRLKRSGSLFIKSFLQRCEIFGIKMKDLDAFLITQKKLQGQKMFSREGISEIVSS